jgi:hypothetical protein
VAFVPINMGAEINTAADEYLPVATADEGTLIFTRKIENNEDFYKSNKLNNQWQSAQYLSNIINTHLLIMRGRNLYRRMVNICSLPAVTAPMV